MEVETDRACRFECNAGPGPRYSFGWRDNLRELRKRPVLAKS